MEEAIRALLLADSGVSILVDDRVNFGSHPEGKPLPSVVINVIEDAEGYNVDGPSGLSDARIQVDCYGLSYSAAKFLSRKVRSALSGHSSGAVQGVFHVGTRDSREGGTNEAERPFRTSLDFKVSYSTQEA